LSLSGFSRSLRSSFDLPESPWFYFWPFLAANSLLAYGNLSLQADLWIFVLGLLVPLIAAFNARPRSPFTALIRKEFFPSIPPWFWLAVYGAALFSRICQIAVWPLWPVSDGSAGAHYAVELHEKWFWGFFFGNAQTAFYWGLAALYKILTPGLFSTLLYSVLISSLIVGVAYWAARPFFPKSISIFCLMAAATGFWVLYTGEFTFLHILALLWQTICLGYLGRLTEAQTEGASRKYALGLGLFTGSGFFIAIAWPVVAFAIFLALAARCSREAKRPWVLPFLVPALGGAFLFLAAMAHENAWRNFQTLWIMRANTDWGRQWTDTACNITSLFWRNWTGAYGPVWGGMLNPLMASLFFLGLVEFKNIRSSALLKWVLAGLLVGLAPGLLAKSFDVFRMVHSYPFQVLVGGLGFQRLLESLPARRVPWLALLFLGISTSLDLFHIREVSFTLSPNGQNLSKAYETLQKNYAPQAPGFVLTDLMPTTGDQSFDLAVYPFNAAVNPDIPPSRAQWVALVGTEDYVPFLNRRFPGIRWYDLGEDAIWKRGRRVLGVIPIRPQDRPVFMSWREVDLYCRAAIFEFLDQWPLEPPETLVQKLWQAPPEIESDPFLESCRDEKILGTLPFPGPRQLGPLVRQALDKGYPLPLFLRIEESLKESKKP
jgi:hypothetical protein